jgi:hypothetical protein
MSSEKTAVFTERKQRTVFVMRGGLACTGMERVDEMARWSEIPRS